MVILLFLAALGRFSDARNQVDEAARDAAREASTYLTPAVATAQADQVADAELSGVCAHPDITIDTSQLHPGGQVTATVRCSVPVGDLLLLKLPGNRHRHRHVDVRRRHLRPGRPVTGSHGRRGGTRTARSRCSSSASFSPWS